MDWRSLLAAAPFARQVGYGGVSATVRLQTAIAIMEEGLREGRPLGQILAAIVNADSESTLNPNAVGDNGHAIGPFQINDLSGKRTFTGDRRDPAYATRWIFADYDASQHNTSGIDYSQGKIRVYAESLAQAYARGATVAEMAGLFGFHVERPARLQASLTERAAHAHSLFPGVAGLPANSLQRIGDVGGALLSVVRTGPSKAMIWAGVLSVLGLVGLLLFRRRW